MASFLRRCKEEINPAQKVDELRPDLNENGIHEQAEFKLTRGSCWHVLFAPDESCFAWISAPKKVILVPWNKTTNSVERPKPTVHSLLDTFPGVGENTRDSHGENESRPWITIECGFPVLSVAFGTGIPQQAGVTTGKRPKSHWTRFDFSKQTILATGHTNGRIRIWNVQTGTLLLELVGHKSGVRDVAFSPDGSLRLISASLDKTLKGWDLDDDGNMFHTFSAHSNGVVSCCWSPNARLMVSAGSDKTVVVWDMEKYKLVRKLEGHFHEVASCSFSPDGAVLATASWDSQVILWDPWTGLRLRSLYHLHPPPNMIYASGANSAWVRGVSFAQNGLNIATVSDDHLIRFWNLVGDADPENLGTEDQEILSCGYSPSGRSFAVGTAEFKVSFYTTPAIIPTLAHLSRMAIRARLLTGDVEQLEIPESLKSFLQYKVWN